MRKSSIAKSAAIAFICTRRSEEHTSELQSQSNLVCRLLLEKKKKLFRYHLPTLAADCKNGSGVGSGLEDNHRLPPPCHFKHRAAFDATWRFGLAAPRLTSN